jgi:hypothetical protein
LSGGGLASIAGLGGQANFAFNAFALAPTLHFEAPSSLEEGKSGTLEVSLFGTSLLAGDVYSFQIDSSDGSAHSLANYLPVDTIITLDAANNWTADVPIQALPDVEGVSDVDTLNSDGTFTISATQSAGPLTVNTSLASSTVTIQEAANPVNPRDTIGAAAEIFQFMTGKVPDAASMANVIGVLSNIANTLTSAAAWDAVGASLADSTFAPVFAATFKNLDTNSFINKVTQQVFGQTINTPAVQNEYQIFKNYYAAAFDPNDPTGDIRAKGSFIADMLHEASDIHFGQYYNAGQNFISAVGAGTAHYDASLF